MQGGGSKSINFKDYEHLRRFMVERGGRENLRYLAVNHRKTASGREKKGFWFIKNRRVIAKFNEISGENWRNFLKSKKIEKSKTTVNSNLICERLN